MNKTIELQPHVDKIKQAVNIICAQNNLKQPLTIPSAGRLIAEHNGIDYAIELFENAYIECKESSDTDTRVFSSAAYKATLDIVLLPKKVNP